MLIAVMTFLLFFGRSLLPLTEPANKDEKDVFALEARCRKLETSYEKARELALKYHVEIAKKEQLLRELDQQIQRCHQSELGMIRRSNYKKCDCTNTIPNEAKFCPRCGKTQL